jgi:hypothetical protein
MKKYVSVFLCFIWMFSILPKAHAEAGSSSEWTPDPKYLPYAEVGRFSEGLAQVVKNNKWGYVDRTGKEVISLQYQDANSFSEGMAPVQINGKWGFIDKTGKQMIKPQFVNIFSNFTEGLALVSQQVKLKDEYVVEVVGYIDKKGKKVIGFKDLDFGGSPFSNGLAVVRDGGQYSFYIIANPLKSKRSSK